jgi:acyl carrier protein
MALEREVVDFINRDLLRGTPHRVGADTYLFEIGLVDSLRILQLIAFVELRTGRTIADRDVVMEHFRSPRAIAARFA